MNRIMLDLETLGNKPGSVILAIGAVKFDPGTMKITGTFYQRITPDSCLKAGLKMDASTVGWWLEQKDTARKEACMSWSHGIELTQALTGFSLWAQGVSKVIPVDEVWGDGATFDNVLLTCAYDACGMQRPWSYKADRCYRTLRAMYPNVTKQGSAADVAHVAVDDAREQAIHLMNILKEMRRT